MSLTGWRNGSYPWLFMSCSRLTTKSGLPISQEEE